MKFVVLLVLAALWAVVLVPPLLRARTRTSRSGDSIGDFNHHLGVLSRTNGNRRRGARAQRMPVLSPAIVPGRLPPIPSRALAPQRAAKRRRDITLGLMVAVALTLAFAVFAHTSAMWALQGLVDVLLVAYLALVAWFRSQQLERTRTVHYLPSPRPAPEFALRRTGSS